MDAGTGRDARRCGSGRERMPGPTHRGEGERNVATLLNRKGLRQVQWRDGESRRTLSLGRIDAKTAQGIRQHVDRLVTAKHSAGILPKATAEWLADIGSTLHAKLAALGLATHRAESQAAELGVLFDAYIKRRHDLKPRSIANLQQARRSLVGFFGERKDAGKINRAEAKDWERSAKAKLARATVSTHVKKARQVFADAVDRGTVAANPFIKLKAGSQANASRQQYVSVEDIRKVIAACPDAEWKLIFGLARFAGLRTPSESFGLKWPDIDDDGRKMLVRSPKTEHHEGRDVRFVPVCPELQQLLDAYDPRGDGKDHSADRVISQHRISNVATTARKIIERAGLTPWPRLFNNLRASCQTDWTAKLPLHAVCAMIGNSELIAARHYLQVTDSHFAEIAEPDAFGALRVALRGLENASDDSKKEAAKTAGEPLSSQPDYPQGESKKLLLLAGKRIKHHDALRRALRALNEAAPHIRAAEIENLERQIAAVRGC